MTDLLRPAPPDKKTDRALRARRGAARLRLLAWPVYFGVLAWYVDENGLPYANDVVFCCLIGALVAASVHSGRGLRGSLLVLRDWVPVMAVVWVYSLLRGYGAHTPWPVRFEPQLSIDTFLGGGETWTVRLQEWLYHPGRPRWYDYAGVAVYMSHFFVIFVTLAVLWRRDHGRFRQLLAGYVLLTYVGFATYILYPADPPWLTSLQGHMPDVTRVVQDLLNSSGMPRAGSIFENGSQFANDVAAMPSLHAAYPMLLAVFFWRTANRPARVLLAAYPPAMAFVLVYGAEHFIIDVLVGWAYAAGVWYALDRFLRARRAKRERRAGETSGEPAGA